MLFALAFCTCTVFGYAKAPMDVSDGPNSDIPSTPSQPIPYALSSTYLTFLAHQEQYIYKETKKYAEQLEERLRLAKRYLRDYEDSVLKGTDTLPKDADPWQKAVHTASHPIMAYRMVRRFAQDFYELGTHVNMDLETGTV